jgi:hypothetical protein
MKAVILLSSCWLMLTAAFAPQRTPSTRVLTILSAENHQKKKDNHPSLSSLWAPLTASFLGWSILGQVASASLPVETYYYDQHGTYIHIFGGI